VAQRGVSRQERTPTPPQGMETPGPRVMLTEMRAKKFQY